MNRHKTDGRRQMARPVTRQARRRHRSRWNLPLGIVAAGLAVAVVAGGMDLLAGRPTDSGSASSGPPATVGLVAAPTGQPGGSASPTATNLAGNGAGASVRSPQPGRTSAPSATQRPSPTARPAEPTPAPSPGPTVSTHPGAAPVSAAEFDLDGQVIDITFPLLPQTRYRYRNNFLNPRSGPPLEYNHARLRADGELIRLHDGIDIYATEGEPVVAPFNGVVIDPADRWPPWEGERYGLTVVIISEEPTSTGYAGVLVHLDRAWVVVGQQVMRGQVLGVLGGTGNAESADPQLHFELRAPFEIDWSSLGEDRPVDAFNPFPSLERADPHR